MNKRTHRPIRTPEGKIEEGNHLRKSTVEQRFADHKNSEMGISFVFDHSEDDQSLVAIFIKGDKLASSAMAALYRGGVLTEEAVQQIVAGLTKRGNPQS